MLALNLAATEDTKRPKEPIPKPKCNVIITITIDTRRCLRDCSSARDDCVTLAEI